MLLKANDKLRVTVDLTLIGVTAQGDTSNNGQPAGLVNKNEEFVIIVKPPTGSVLDIDRVAPAAVAAVNNLG
jgi:archaellin